MTWFCCENFEVLKLLYFTDDTSCLQWLSPLCSGGVPVTPAHDSIESMGNQALVLLMNHQERCNYFPATQSILPLIRHVLSC